MQFTGREDLEKVLRALAEQLEALPGPRVELVVIGGTALNVLGLVSRTTRDVDLLGVGRRDEAGCLDILRADPLPERLAAAALLVAEDYDLADDWLNPGPTSLVDLGLPEGLVGRLVTAEYGPALAVHFASRVDQIHFKLYAAVDRGGYHIQDLLALGPTAAETEAAARWSMTHDVSEGYRMVLKDLLGQLGFADVAGRI